MNGWNELISPCQLMEKASTAAMFGQKYFELNLFNLVFLSSANLSMVQIPNFR